MAFDSEILLILRSIYLVIPNYVYWNPYLVCGSRRDTWQWNRNYHSVQEISVEYKELFHEQVTQTLLDIGAYGNDNVSD